MFGVDETSKAVGDDILGFLNEDMEFDVEREYETE